MQLATQTETTYWAFDVGMQLIVDACDTPERAEAGVLFKGIRGQKFNQPAIYRQTMTREIGGPVLEESFTLIAEFPPLTT